MAGYIRQSTFVDGDTITAALFNNEYNQLVNAFSNTTGHKHDGTTAEGPVIGLIGDAGETSPNNKVLIDTTNNHIEFYVEVSSNPVQQIYIADGAIVPVTDSDVDLGTSSLYFKDAYIDSVTTTGNVSVGGNLTVTGNATISGNLTFGDADTDSINLSAEIDSNIVPNTDDTYDLGTSTKQWRNLYIDGTAEIDTLAIDGTTVTSTAAELNILDGVTSTAAELNILDGVTSTTAELNILDGVTATATEINLLDGVTSTTAELNILDGVTATATEINLLDGVTSTTAELNILDGVTSTATELNIVDGDTAATSTTLADADRVVVNDNGTMVQVALTDFETYFEGALDTLSNVTTVGALNAGSITSGFGSIDNGSSAITTTGTVTYGSLSDGTITITAFADEDDMSSNSATLVPTQQSVKAYVDSQVTAQDLDATTDSGTIAIDLDSETLTIAGGEGIDTSAATNTITIAGEDASTTNKGIASFSSDDFTVSSGAVSLATTSTAAELNILDGATVTTAELNILDGVTSTAAELNILDGVTSTTAELNILDGVTSTAAELNILDGKAFLDEDNMASNSATGIASQQSIKAYVDSQVGAVSTDVVSDTTPQLGGDLDLNSNDITGTGNINITGTIQSSGNITGTLATAAQTNITSVGTLTGLAVNGNTTLTTTDNSNTLTLISTDADAAVGPLLDLYRNSGSPADDDFIGKINFRGRNDNSQDVNYGSLAYFIQDASDGTEDAFMQMSLMKGGSSHLLMEATSTETVFNQGSVDQDFRVESNGETHAIFVDAGNDEIGMFTSAPNALLHIGDSNAEGDATNPALQIGGTSTFRLGMYTSAEGGVIENKNGDDGLQFRVKTKGEAMRIDGGTGDVFIGATSQNTGGFGSVSPQLQVAGSMPQVLLHETDTDKDGYIGISGSVMFIQTADAIPIRFGTSDAERMRIDSSGLVSIGTTSAHDSNALLTLSKSAVASSVLKSTTNTVTFANVANGSSSVAYSGTASNHPYYFMTNGSERMRIDSSGNVGINLTNPSDYYNASLAVSLPSEGSLTLASTNTTNWNYILFADGTSGDAAYRGQVAYNHQNDILALASSGYMTLSTGSGRTERMRVASNGRTSIGTTTTNAGLTVANADIRCTGAAVANDANSISMSQESGGGFLTARGPSTSTRGTISLNVSLSTGGSGIVGLKVENTGNVTIAGALSKGSGSFKIDHPLESKKNTHHLVHSFVEAPQADNIYRGVVTLVDGSATINLDTEAGMTEGTFVLLNTNTSCFTSNESDWDAVKGSVSGNILTISCQNTSSTATVSWLVIGERHDQHMIDTDWTDENGKVIVEPLKGETE